MNRITEIFMNLKKDKQIAFMPFFVAGYPNFKISLRVFKQLANQADLLEIGFPYSDPLADGPVIQEADKVALEAGMNTDKVFELIKQIRKQSNIPITVLVYANLVYQFGIEKFYLRAKQVGIDGVLIPDVPAEEMKPYYDAAKKFGVYNICLISSTSPAKRLKKILPMAQGYLYLTSVVGITGVRKGIPNATIKYLKFLQSKTELPIAVGFGISNSKQVTQLKKAKAEGFIVGSQLIKVIRQSGFRLPKSEIFVKLIS